MGQLGRRHFLMGAGLLVAAPFARAQTKSVKHARVGYLNFGSRATAPFSAHLPPALRELGWEEGRNLTLEWRYAEGVRERLAEQAAELARLSVDVVIAVNHIDVNALQRVNPAIPIVLVNAVEPIGAGYAKSLSRPGGNVTGLMWADPTFSAKRVQLLKETYPAMQRYGALYPEGTPQIGPYLDAAEAAASALGISYLRFPVRGNEDVEAVLHAAKNARVDALSITTQGPVAARTDQIVAFASRYKMLTFFTSAAPVDRGGLMSYTPNIPEAARRAAAIVDKILRGAKPGDLPFEYLTRYELVINLKTAQQIGITIPQSILLRADRLIE